MLLVTAMLAILAGIGVFEYASSYRQSLIKNTGDSAVALLRLAQQKAVAQESGFAWGVYVDNTDPLRPYLNMYSGDSYSLGAATERFQVPGQVSVQSPANGTARDINFQKFSGVPNASTTIVFGLRGSSQTKTITLTEQGGISSN